VSGILDRGMSIRFTIIPHSEDVIFHDFTCFEKFLAGCTGPRDTNFRLITLQSEDRGIPARSGYSLRR
jgi:hypothetical protein